MLELLLNHMDEWVTGDPARLDTDMGPVIDPAAQTRLENHIAGARKDGRLIYRGPGPAGGIKGYFVSPAIIEIKQLSELKEEVFGPVLHVLRYDSGKLEALLEQVNDLGYGLTLGIQSRIEHQAQYIRQRVRTGNVYVNRNMVGAVVGVQPFGGCGLSGTGPKAGGPHYLLRFTTEQSLYRQQRGNRRERQPVDDVISVKQGQRQDGNTKDIYGNGCRPCATGEILVFIVTDQVIQ